MKRMNPTLAKEYLGLKNGKLSRCPETPNCVCSQYSDDRLHYLEPIRMTISSEKAKQIIVQIFNQMKDTKIVKNVGNYLHIEFKSAVFKFVDDVEVYIDSKDNVIHFRSASRLGFWDLNQNRKRMSRVIKEYEKRQS